MITQLPPETRKVLDEGAHEGSKYCGQCGAVNAWGNRFCIKCGHPFVAKAEAGPRSQPPLEGAPAQPTPPVAAMRTQASPPWAEIVPARDQLAGFGTRFLAFLIDVILLGIVAGLLRGFDLRGIASLADFVYFVAFWSTTGRTVGMLAMGIRLVRTDGQPLTWITGLLRYVGYVLSIIPLFLGLLWILWDRNKQGWHDKIAHTLVIRTA